MHDSVAAGKNSSFLIPGNILIWALTNAKNSTRYELAIDLEDWSGNRRFARYRSFRLGPEKDGFRLHHQVLDKKGSIITNEKCPHFCFQNLFYGNAGDSLYSHNDIPFSTFDVDNDNRDGDFAERSCARLYKVSIFQLFTVTTVSSFQLSKS